MTGIPEWNFPAFHAAASELRLRDREVVNPAEHFDGQTNLPYHTYLRYDLARLVECDHMALLPGWKSSRGATLEAMVATCLQIKVDEYPLMQPAQGVMEAFRALWTEHKEESVIQEALRLVYGARGADYGHPFHDFSRTAKIWSAILGVDIQPKQVALCMIGIKISRECNAPKRDNWVDIAGYADCGFRADTYET